MNARIHFTRPVTRPVTRLAAALMLAFAAPPVIAASASDDAHTVNKMRVANVANAQKLLDQEGGSRIVFKVDDDALREAMMTDLRDEVFKTLHDERIPFTGLAVRQGSVEVRIMDAGNQQKLVGKLAPAAPSGAAAVAAIYGDEGLMQLAPTDSGFTMRLRSLTMQSFEMMEQALRNNSIAAALKPDGDGRIAVLLPGVNDPDRVAAIFSKRSKVAFRLVDSSMSPEEAQKGSPPTGSEVVLGFKNNQPYLLQKEVEIDGDDIIEASPGFQNDQPIALFRFNGHGTRRFAHLTADNIGRPFAIVINERVMSAPIIREPILAGSGQISGNFTLQEANTVAMLLRSGTLPGHLSVVDQQVIKPVGNAARQ
ncbi:MAG TPA: preprotein translocase subunit SecD [Bradyrhizobium sp.]